jgi:hypothetical protein
LESQQIEEYPLSKVKIADLIFDKTNPNQPTQEQINAIRKSFLQFGFCVPITVNEKMEIGDGEHRALIYKELGLAEIPAFIIPKLNDDIQRRLHRQTMNKLKGVHEWKLDAEEIALIFKADKLDNLAELIATPRASLEKELSKHKGIQFNDDNFNIEKKLAELEPKTKLGDIWQLGDHKVMCADSTDARAIKQLVGDKNIDMVLTDPPFDLDEESTYRIYQIFEALTDLQFWQMGDKQAVQLCSKAQKFVRFFIQDWLQPYMINATMPMAQHNLIAQLGSRPTKNLKDGFSTVLRVNTTKTSGASHLVFAWSKRPELPKMFISHFYNEGENNIIMDPFGGSGTTLLAAEMCKVPCYCIELVPKYVDLIVSRWENFTQQKAELLTN